MLLQHETVVAPPAELARVFASRVEAIARRVQGEHRSLSLVVPGGSVAEQFFPVLAASAIDWRVVDLFWGDERAVPPNDPASNYRVAEELLLPAAGIDRARVHRMPGDVAAAQSYEAEVVKVLGARLRFDVVLLGVGPDGHVCSLFPGHPALDERERLVTAITDSPKPPPERMTLTLPALEGAAIFVAAFGASKADVIREAISTPDSPLPVARAARSGRPTVFLLDQVAASQL